MQFTKQEKISKELKISLYAANIFIQKELNAKLVNKTDIHLLIEAQKANHERNSRKVHDRYLSSNENLYMM